MKADAINALDIPTWKELISGSSSENLQAEKVSLFEGDITTLKVDAIVNAGCTKFQISTGGM